MATAYPTAIDTAGGYLPNPGSNNDRNNPSLASGQDNQNSAIIALESLIGTNASQTTPSAQYNILQATSSSASEWGLLTINNVSSSTGTGDFVFATSPTLTTPTLSSPTIDTPTFSGSLGSISTSTITASGAITGNGGISTTTISASGNTTLSGTLSVTDQTTLQGSTAIPAGGATTDGILLSSTSSFGIFFGSGAPTLSAAQGSIYLRSDGSSTSTRLYVNTNGSTTWTNVTTAA